YFDTETGDVAQYYNQSSASTGLRVKETQEPNLILGYHHEWGPGSHTLFLGGRFDDTLQLHDDAPQLLFLQTAVVPPFIGPTNISLRNPVLFDLGYRSELTAYSGELQHIWQTPQQTLVIGGRFQGGTTETSTELAQFGTSVTNQHVDADLNRLSVYGY